MLITSRPTGPATDLSAIRRPATSTCSRSWSRTAERSLPDRAVECFDQALALWQGDAFGEFFGEWWALAEATRLGERRLLAQGGAGSVLDGDRPPRPGHSPISRRYLLNSRLASGAVELLMQALDAKGRRVEALRAFREYPDPPRSMSPVSIRPTNYAAWSRRLVGGLEPTGQFAPPGNRFAALC